MSSEGFKRMIRIMVIDDQAVVRQGFVSLINTVADMEVIAQGVNGQQAIDLYREHRPDITLMDLRMPVLGGVDAIAQIRHEFPDARIIVLTTYDGDEDIYRALQAGAQGYLLKDMFFEELEDAIRKVHAGARSLPPVVAEIVNGKRNKEIASALRISEATVKSHINNILGKLGVTDRTQAATRALQRGIVRF